VNPSSNHLRAADSSTGNLNYCFVIEDVETSHTIFIKQAPDFVKCLGEEAKLTVRFFRGPAGELCA
jgi:5-methylthioribose kinase